MKYVPLCCKWPLMCLRFISVWMMLNRKWNGCLVERFNSSLFFASRCVTLQQKSVWSKVEEITEREPNSFIPPSLVPPPFPSFIRSLAASCYCHVVHSYLAHFLLLFAWPQLLLTTVSEQTRRVSPHFHLSKHESLCMDLVYVLKYVFKVKVPLIETVESNLF